MMGTLLAVLFAANMLPVGDAHVVPYGQDRVAIYSVNHDWNEPAGINGVAVARFDTGLRAAHARRVVCIRSDHDQPGDLMVTSERFPTVIIPHGTGLATRCAEVTTFGWTRRRPAHIEVAEGTYFGNGGTVPGPVQSWVRSVKVGTVAQP